MNKEIEVDKETLWGLNRSLRELCQHKNTIIDDLMDACKKAEKHHQGQKSEIGNLLRSVIVKYESMAKPSEEGN